jgi:trehalose/maltose transport system substrate-binding protein
VIWPGILASHFIDLSEHVPEDQVSQHFPAIVENNTVDGVLVAMPWFTDAGILYYRQDLLEKYGKEPPTTWQELTETAKEIQDGERAEGNDKMLGFVFQARAYEGLTCDALEWIASYGGGTIVDEEGAITVNNEKAAQALDLAATWIGSIAPEGVLNYTEEEARGVFQSGNAVFMRNWPYAWALGNADDSAVKGKIAVSTLPKGGADGKHTATLGGWQLAVSKYSAHAEIAADLVAYLTSADEQKRRAIEGSYNPTIPALYEDQEVLEAVPFFGELYDTFVNAVARPSKVTGIKYNQVSSEFFNAAHDVLSGKASGADRLAELESSLDHLSRGGRW